MKRIKLYQTKPGQVISLNLIDWRKIVTVISNNMVKTDLGYHGAVVMEDAAGKTLSRTSKHGGTNVLIVSEQPLKKEPAQMAELFN